MDIFPEPLPDEPSLGQSYLENNISSDTPVLFNDSTGSWPLATTGLADNPFQDTGFDRVELPVERSSPNDSNDMVESSLFPGGHFDTEAKPTSSSALHSLPTGKPDEADDKITVADFDRLLDINHGKVCNCMNCLPFSHHLAVRGLERQFPALEKISCRIEGCSWNLKIEHRWPRWHVYLKVMSHEDSHFYQFRLDQDQKLIITCKDDRCRIRTKRMDDVRRHYATMHCKNPQRFPCHVIGCKFGGENGFTRKDKLTSHMKSTHKGLPLPGKRLQAIKPKAGVSNVGVHKAGSQA